MILTKKTQHELINVFNGNAVCVLLSMNSSLMCKIFVPYHAT